MTVYVDNVELYNNIVLWKAELSDNPATRIPDSIGLAIMNIANGFTNYWRFSRYTESWKELMVGDAVETCIKYLKSFDTDKYNNPHAYLTMICARCFIQRIRIEKKREAAKYKFFVEHVYDEDDEDMAKLVDYDFYSDMLGKVSEFEATQKKPTKKPKVQPIGISWMESDEDE